MTKREFHLGDVLSVTTGRLIVWPGMLWNEGRQRGVEFHGWGASVHTPTGPRRR